MSQFAPLDLSIVGRAAAAIGNDARFRENEMLRLQALENQRRLDQLLVDSELNRRNQFRQTNLVSGRQLQSELARLQAAQLNQVGGQRQIQQSPFDPRQRLQAAAGLADSARLGSGQRAALEAFARDPGLSSDDFARIARDLTRPPDTGRTVSNDFATSLANIFGLDESETQDFQRLAQNGASPNVLATLAARRASSDFKVQASEQELRISRGLVDAALQDPNLTEEQRALLEAASVLRPSDARRVVLQVQAQQQRQFSNQQLSDRFNIRRNDSLLERQVNDLQQVASDAERRANDIARNLRDRLIDPSRGQGAVKIPEAKKGETIEDFRIRLNQALEDREAIRRFEAAKKEAENARSAVSSLLNERGSAIGGEVPGDTQQRRTQQFTVDNPARPTTQEEFDRLPSGAVFVNPSDGQLRRKP